MSNLDAWFGLQTGNISDGVMAAEGLQGIYSDNGAELRREAGGLIANLMFQGEPLDSLNAVVRKQCIQAGTLALEAARGDVAACQQAYLEMDEAREREICETTKSPHVVARRMVVVIARQKLRAKHQAARLCPECGSHSFVVEEAGELVCYGTHDDGAAVTLSNDK